MIKKEIRIVGVDDSYFERNQEKVLVVATIFRGGLFLDGLLSTYVELDGKDATEKLTKMINNSRHKKQIKVLMLDGITLAGFNIVDIKELYEKTNIPIIVINRKMPDLEKVERALRNFEDYEERMKKIKNAGEIKKFKKLYYQKIGLSDIECQKIIEISTTRGDIPEPLRIAHIIATGIVRGESYGRA
ncbi:MAG: DUF99 family protein [Candidatus Aenigmarchaeota archaeon]|nr:DUF99 family protein [Candidatus Aenigmarchaeota archaeon]MDW8149194.1 DUF99 family protein [Candidatus Aenigmarchaeota archaeon]